MSSNGQVQTDDEGNVTISPPLATASSAGLEPGAAVAAVEAPEYVVYVHAGKPVLYQLYREES